MKALAKNSTKTTLVRQVLLVIFLNKLKRFKKIERIYEKQVNHLFGQKDVNLKIRNIRIVNVCKLECTQVNVSISSADIEIEKIVLDISIKKLFLKRQFMKALLVGVEDIKINISEAQNTRKNTFSQDNKNGSSLPYWEKIYYPVFRKISSIIFEFPIELNLKFGVIKIARHNFDIGWLTCLNDKLSMQVGINQKTLLVSGVLKRQQRVIVLDLIKPINSNSNCQFDNLYFSYHENFDSRDKRNTIVLAFKFTNLLIDHRLISESAFSITNLELEFQIKFDDDSFNITNESGGVFEQVLFAFDFTHVAVDNDLIRANFYIELEGSTFLASFPELYVEELKSINFKGKITLQVRCMFAIDNPFNHFFEIVVLNNDLDVIDIGRFSIDYLMEKGLFDLKKVNGSHSAFTSIGEKVRLNAINPKMKELVVVAEDPDFYRHSGLDKKAFEHAIVTNVLQRRFIRGGSTITMQIARNLFLKHNKNIFRKLEEIIIALLLENYFKLSKDTLLELYLNIIEFAPNVYGIKKASFYYFSKPPLDLSITECLVLTYIIPRPKHFHEALLLMTPQLLTNLPEYIHHFSLSLLEKKIISQDEYGGINEAIKFSNGFGEISLSYRKG